MDAMGQERQRKERRRRSELYETSVYAHAHASAALQHSLASSLSLAHEAHSFRQESMISKVAEAVHIDKCVCVCVCVWEQRARKFGKG